MSEHIAADIWIGGPIIETVAADLIDVIQSQVVTREHGGPVYTPGSVSDLVAEAAYSDGILHLCDDQATWGAFDELETFLIKHDVAFDRQTEAKYEYNAELIQFRAGMKRPHRWFTTQDGEILIPREPIKRLFDKLKEGATLSLSKNRLKRLAESIGPRIPKLAPLKLIKQ